MITGVEDAPLDFSQRTQEIDGSKVKDAVVCLNKEWWRNAFAEKKKKKVIYLSVRCDPHKKRKKILTNSLKTQQLCIKADTCSHPLKQPTSQQRGKESDTRQSQQHPHILTSYLIITEPQKFLYRDFYKRTKSGKAIVSPCCPRIYEC